ncbi:glycoside hydrolase family 3 C-terminal domain-containing protein [Nonomuraea sp. JJY05]|uniref:glycoside hydrolase family 3 C-terminal domain-containing protein n=1 Tax=Nonomuraea sp. JJY05 TaxID=3350255 RepID=UPI00373DFF49
MRLCHAEAGVDRAGHADAAVDVGQQHVLQRPLLGLCRHVEHDVEEGVPVADGVEERDHRGHRPRGGQDDGPEDPPVPRAVHPRRVDHLARGAGVEGAEHQDVEDRDRARKDQALLRAVAEVRPETVLVTMSSYPYALDWADEHLPAVVWTSHGGQETGRALAAVLLGRVS